MASQPASSDRVWVRDLPALLGRVARVRGWSMPGGISDRTGTVALRRVSAEPPPGSAVEAVGEVVAGRCDGEVELAVTALEVAGPSERGAPPGPGASLEERLDWRWLDLRRAEARLVFEVQSTLERAMRRVWEREGFVELHSPKLLPTGPRTEELFRLDYFGRPAWLAQSPQFYKQMAMAAGFERVFEIGPVFRAEAALSPRHATEFTSLDVEMAWIGSHEEVMASAEELLVAAVGEVAAVHGGQLAQLLGVEVAELQAPFPRLSLAEAWAQAGRPAPPGQEEDLDPEAERALCEKLGTGGQQLLWVTAYPERLRPFYHMRCEDGSSASRSFDLVWNGLEVASGAQREHRHERLVAQALARGLPLEPIAHYLDFFRFGCPPHGGFGFGLNRLLMALLGEADLREVTYLPRDRLRLFP